MDAVYSLNDKKHTLIGLSFNAKGVIRFCSTEIIFCPASCF